ncbi:MAG: hypothetical protein HY898_23575 [Deltaproteobacteria bacterium]|nr:hypothetical protein [Deltaproteobacteria bacterium]
MAGPRIHSTNYFDTFITVAPDCAASGGTVPLPCQEPTIAARVFRMVREHPYEFTSDDVIFTVWADRRGIPTEDRAKARAVFFSKGQPCLRCSDLVKKYGWGIHADGRGRIALVGINTPEYEAFVAGRRPVALKAAMSSPRK